MAFSTPPTKIIHNVPMPVPAPSFVPVKEPVKEPVEVKR